MNIDKGTYANKLSGMWFVVTDPQATIIHGGVNYPAVAGFWKDKLGKTYCIELGEFQNKFHYVSSYTNPTKHDEDKTSEKATRQDKFLQTAKKKLTEHVDGQAYAVVRTMKAWGNSPNKRKADFTIMNRGPIRQFKKLESAQKLKQDLLERNDQEEYIIIPILG